MAGSGTLRLVGDEMREPMEQVAGPVDVAASVVRDLERAAVSARLVGSAGRLEQLARAFEDMAMDLNEFDQLARGLLRAAWIARHGRRP